MRYLILLYGDPTGETALSADDRRAIVDEHMAFSARLRERGVLLDGDAVEEHARVVRAGLVTDGPFAETKEQLGGFYVVDVPDLDAALAIAARLPTAAVGSIEVRPIPSYGG